MEAKEFLKQLKKLDCMIENKLIEKKQWLDIACGTSIQTSGEKVQSSGNQQRMADAVCNYIDIEKEIDSIIDELVDRKREVISVIEQLDFVEYDLLHKVYVQDKTLDDVAEVYNKSYSLITTIHGRALKNVQNILNKKNSL